MEPRNGRGSQAFGNPGLFNSSFLEMREPTAQRSEAVFVVVVVPFFCFVFRGFVVVVILGFCCCCFLLFLIM